VTAEALEEIRRELRGIMHCRNKPRVIQTLPLEIDVTDIDEQSKHEIVKLEGLDDKWVEAGTAPGRIEDRARGLRRAPGESGAAQRPATDGREPKISTAAH
jgi:hypothetical protein